MGLSQRLSIAPMNSFFKIDRRNRLAPFFPCSPEMRAGLSSGSGAEWRDSRCPGSRRLDLRRERKKQLLATRRGGGQHANRQTLGIPMERQRGGGQTGAVGDEGEEGKAREP